MIKERLVLTPQTLGVGKPSYQTLNNGQTSDQVVFKLEVYYLVCFFPNFLITTPVWLISKIYLCLVNPSRADGMNSQANPIPLRRALANPIP